MYNARARTRKNTCKNTRPYHPQNPLSNLHPLQESLVALGLAPEEKGHVINILTSILILGQIQFVEEDDVSFIFSFWSMACKFS